MADVTAAKTHMIIAIVVIIMGAAYLIFLAATWTQLQHDRRASFARVDEILDRFPKAEVVKSEVVKDAADASTE